MSEARFRGTDRYVATDDLMMAVNAAVTLGRPLLVKGEPGTGKTQLAEEVANALNRPFIQWHIKSTTKAQQGLYEYDAVSRLRDSQLGEARVHEIGNYIVKGKLWEAFTAELQPVLLIDEIDKADIEFPNDLLLELDRMEFYVYETQQVVKARHRPIIIITSNNEKELPDAFLRRCFFHYIRFPDKETMERIVQRALSRPEKAPAGRGAGGVLRNPRGAGSEEAAVHLGTAGLDQAAGGRGHPARGAARRPAQADPAAVRRVAEERAGRAPVRAAAVHVRRKKGLRTEPPAPLSSGKGV
jgi:MoxR-like ATPase